MLKRIISIIVLLIMAASLAGCNKSTSGNEGAAKLSFKAADSYEELKRLDGKEVTINGYLATSSPADGSFIFLMNLPFQSCPFCVPNTSQLSNTIEVYPKNGDTFSFTNQAVKVTGTMNVAPEGETYSDPYGYQFSFKITDADYTILNSEDISADLAVWQRIADSGIVSELYQMYDYIYFVCTWPTYSMNSFYDESGNLVPSYYLWPADVESILMQDGAQYNYGYKDDYFAGLYDKVMAFNEPALDDIAKNIKAAEQIAQEALQELKDGNYTSEIKELPEFGVEGHSDTVFTLNKGTYLTQQADSLYQTFASWLSAWEM